jgi:serralysin
MKSKFDLEQPYPSDDTDFGTSGNTIYASLAPWLGEDGGMSHTGGTSGSASGQIGPNATIAVTSGGIVINLLFDAAAMAAPASFRAGIQQAAALLSAAIFDPITVNLTIHYTGTGGGAFAGPDQGLYENYSSIRADLINDATPGDTTFNALPSGSSIQGQSLIAVWNAQLKLWGLMGANDTTTDDGAATFATDINPNLLVGVALHELTHAFGRIPYGPQPDIFDLFRFTSVGTRLFVGGDTAPAAYFSVDGGITKLADFGQNSDPSDFLNSGVQGPNDPFNEFYTGSTSQGLSAVDKAILDALGFHTAPPAVTTVIEAFGSTKLVEVGNNYYLYSNSSGTGPELQYGGTPVVAGAGQFSGWAPIGAEQIAGGYNVAWKDVATNQYSIWTTDSSGNFITSTGAVAGTIAAVETCETTLHQDLNSDGVIGIPAAQASSDTPSGAVSQPISVVVASNDTFVFGRGDGAAANAGKFDMIEHDAWIGGNHPTPFLQDPQTGQWQAHAMIDELNTIINPGNHDGSAATNLHLIDPHVGHFILS